MAFFDKLGEMAKNIGDRTGDAIETNKLGSKIKAETEAAGEELKKIGAFYYERFAQDGKADPEVLEFCQGAKSHYDAAVEAQAEIDRIKAENEAAKAAAVPETPAVPAGITCPSCGAANAPDTRFCCGCGNKLEAPAPAPTGMTCPVCGAANAPGTKFCCGCGAKLEAPAPVPAGMTCPSCGAANAPGTKFCCECGAKLEAPVIPAEPEKVTCPACGTEIGPGVKFCPECGAKKE